MSPPGPKQRAAHQQTPHPPGARGMAILLRAVFEVGGYGAPQRRTAFDGTLHDPFRSLESACGGPAAVGSPQAGCDPKGHGGAGEGTVAAGVAPGGGGFTTRKPAPRAGTSNAKRYKVCRQTEGCKLTLEQHLADIRANWQGECGTLAHPVHK